MTSKRLMKMAQKEAMLRFHKNMAEKKKGREMKNRNDRTQSAPVSWRNSTHARTVAKHFHSNSFIQGARYVIECMEAERLQRKVMNG